MRRERAIAGRNVIVQVIHVTWNKAARGAPGAVRRNQIPLTLALPSALGPDVGRHLLIHESHWGQANDFARELGNKIVIADSTDGYCFGCAKVRPVQAGAELEWIWDSSGSPARQTRDSAGNPVPLVHRSTATENKWVRARWNVRRVDFDTGDWWYELTAVNVGTCPDAVVPSDFFTSSEPSDDFAEIARLR